MNKKFVYAMAIFFLIAGFIFLGMTINCLYQALTNPKVDPIIMCLLAADGSIFGGGMAYLSIYTVR